MDHLDSTRIEDLEELLREYADLFLEECELLPSASQLEHSITLGTGAQPIYKSLYHVPYAQMKVSHQEIQRLLDSKVIRLKRPSVMCKDYRVLNNVTKKEYYPLPNISDSLQGYKVESKALFSVNDVAEAYHQISMEDKNIPLRGFDTYDGYY